MCLIVNNDITDGLLNGDTKITAYKVVLRMHPGANMRDTYLTLYQRHPMSMYCVYKSPWSGGIVRRESISHVDKHGFHVYLDREGVVRELNYQIDVVGKSPACLAVLAMDCYKEDLVAGGYCCDTKSACYSRIKINHEVADFVYWLRDTV